MHLLVLATAVAVPVSSALAVPGTRVGTAPSLAPRQPPRFKPISSPLLRRRRQSEVLCAANNSPPPSEAAAAEAAALRRTLLPIWLAVFVQMLGVGVTLSTLPLFMVSLGATATHLGWTISLFSGAQMIGCPVLVSLSNRPGVGRLAVLRACLTGNAIAAIMTAAAGGWKGVTCARILAGGFAASVPVAQVAVADLAPPGPATSRALATVSSAASLGIVLGPALGGIVSEVARRAFGVPAHMESRVVFACSGLLAACVLMLTTNVKLKLPATSAPAQGSTSSRSVDESGGGGGGGATAVSAAPPPSAPLERIPNFAQPLLRWIALVCSLSITTGIAIYALFCSRFLGYAQPELSLSQSSAALVALTCQVLVLPRLFTSIGEARTCALGLVTLGITFASFSLVRTQPLHFLLFIAARGAWALADVSTAALTASSSPPERRARNLALLQSFQSASRLASPLVASSLYTFSLGSAAAFGPPGALPFLFVGALALATAPTPLLLAPKRQSAKAD